MIANSLNSEIVKNQFYEFLRKKDYPEDRVISACRLFDDFVADFVIMAPGIAKVPVAVFEFCRGKDQAGEDSFKSYSDKIKDTTCCACYLCWEEDDQFCFRKREKGIWVESDFPTYQKLVKNFSVNFAYLSELSVENFTMFPKATFLFSKNLNVIIGENGAGKTQLLKLIYTISRGMFNSRTSQDGDFPLELLEIEDVFKTDYRNLISRDSLEKEVKVDIRLGKKHTISLEWGDRKNIGIRGALQNKKLLSSVYLPARELLSIYPHFASLYTTYRSEMDYDKTYFDTITLLGLPRLKSQDGIGHKIYRLIEDVLGGDIFLDKYSNKFMMKTKDGRGSYDIDMTAEGWRKIGEVLQLLRNGAICSGGILLWDEPEANQNPALIRLIAEIVWELSQKGVQIFITTHSLFLLRELEYFSQKKNKPEGIRYFCFHRDMPVEQSNSTYDLSNIVAFEEEIGQEDRIMAFRRKK